MKKLFLFLVIPLLVSGCCIAQIPTQYYFVNDSCEFYLPDYSEAIEVRDNCCIDSTSYHQSPNSGTTLYPGQDITVTITGRDCFGNTRTMQFDVVVIDNVPPTFYYDSTDFFPLGMYQNEERIYRFWSESNTKALYYSQDKTARDRTTNLEEIHDAFFSTEDYFKMSFFSAKSSYRIIDMYMAIAKVGNPQGKLHVEIWQINMSDTSLYYPVCGTVVDCGSIHTRISGNSSDVQPEELIWQTVDVSDGLLIRGGWYAIRTYCTGFLDNDNRVIWNTTAYDYQDRYRFLKYSYDGEESYGVNQEANYMYQIFGVDIV